MPVMNQKSWTKQTFDSLRQHSDLLRTVVVDNGSTDGTKELLDQEPMIGGYIKNPENFGVAKAWNQGCEYAFKKGAEYVIIVNNDIRVSRYWALNLFEAMKKFKLWCVYPTFTEKELPAGWDAQASKVANSDMSVSTNRLTGFCFMVSKEAFDAIGMFDEQFFPGWYEDTDFELRLTKAGHPPMQVSNVLIHHYKNKTLDTIPGFRENMIAINREKFNKKHGLS